MAHGPEELVHNEGKAHCPTEDCDWWVPEGMEYLYESHDCESDEPEYWGEECGGCGEFLGGNEESVVVGEYGSDGYYHLDCYPTLEEDEDDRQAAAEAIHVASSASVTDSYPDGEEDETTD